MQKKKKIISWLNFKLNAILQNIYLVYSTRWFKTGDGP